MQVWNDIRLSKWPHFPPSSLSISSNIDPSTLNSTLLSTLDVNLCPVVSKQSCHVSSSLLLSDILYCDRTKLHVGKNQFAQSATSWAVIFFPDNWRHWPSITQHFQYLQSVQTVLCLFIPSLVFSTIYTYHWVFHDPLWKQSGHLQLILIQVWHNPPPIVSLRTLLLTSVEMVCDENILKLFTKHCTTTCPINPLSSGNCIELYIFGVLQKCR